MHNGQIGSEQLDQLSRQPDGSGGLWSHIESCVQCKATLDKYRKLNAKLDQLATNGVRSTINMNCPDESIWLEVAAGTLSPEESLSYSSHAASCDACAKKLQAAIRIFDSEVSEEEERILDSLPAFHQEASARLPKESTVAEEPVRQPKFDKKTSRRSFWRPFSYAFASIAALMIIGFLSLGLITDNLLARGYTQKGTLEYRITKAAPPKEGTRGPGLSKERPTSLVLADLLIKLRLALSPQNPRWLGEKGRLQLIEGDESLAVSTLEQAHSLDSKSKHIAIDLASAYARTGSKDLLFKAEELLLSVLPLEKDNLESLRGSPDNLEALYNLAILYELAGSFEQAQEAWDKYLLLDSSSAWAEEARRRQKDLNEKRQFRNAPRADSSIEEWMAYLQTNSLSAAEQALDVGVQSWLINRTRSISRLNDLLSFISIKLRKEHGDSWLSDILEIPPLTQVEDAFRALQNAVQLNASGDFEKAVSAAREAQAVFQKTGNAAGLARAQLEEIYSYQRSTNAGVCLQSANQLERSISSKDYPWLKGQLYLDRASCLNMLGLRQQAQEQADYALRLAGTSKYQILSLRALGIAASQATAQGDFDGALTKDVDGLQQYWSGAYPVERAYQFYSDIVLNAESMKLWHVVYDTGVEAARTISQSTHKELEAVVWYRVAEAAVLLEKREDANMAVEQADRLFSSLPQSRTTFAYRADGVLTLAKAKIEVNHDDEAVALLEKSAQGLPSLESHIIASRLYQVKGSIAFKKGWSNDAEMAYGAAVANAEIALNNLRTPLSRIRWKLQNSVIYRLLAQIRLDAGNYEGALEAWEAYKVALIRDKLAVPLTKSQEFHSTHWPQFIRIGDLKPELKPAESMVSYAFLPKGLRAWILDKNGLSSKLLSTNGDDLRHKLREFEQECADPDSDLNRLQLHAKDLYRILLAPFADRLLDVGTLMVETDQDLENFPFQALIDNSGRYLGEAISIIDSPGIVFRNYLRPVKAITAIDKALIVGSSDISGNWRNILAPLPSAKKEAAAVAINFHNPDLFMNEEASYSDIERALPNAVIFHFAGHSIFTKSGPGLILAPSSTSTDNEILTMADLPEDRLYNLKLAVLSACNTLSSADGSIERLAYPFLRAGVPQVIVTRWEIRSSETSSLMKDLYRQLLFGELTHDALRTATVNTRNQFKTQHPYYWAGFAVVGRS